MRHIKAAQEGSRGFIFVFNDTKSAREWAKRLVFGKVIEDNNMEVYIVRHWKEEDLIRMLDLNRNLYVPYTTRSPSNVSGEFERIKNPGKTGGYATHER